MPEPVVSVDTMGGLSSHGPDPYSRVLALSVFGPTPRTARPKRACVSRGSFPEPYQRLVASGALSAPFSLPRSSPCMPPPRSLSMWSPPHPLSCTSLHPSYPAPILLVVGLRYPP